MSRLVLVLLILVPLAGMVAGFAVAARQIFRGRAGLGRAFTANGRPVLRYAPRAVLRSVGGGGAVGGPGSLLLTDREVVFHRFFPRREFRIELRRLVRVGEASGDGREALLGLWWEPETETERRGMLLAVPEAVSWAEAIRRACACSPPGS